VRLLQKDRICASQSIKLQMSIGIRQPDVHDALGMVVAVRKEAEAVDDPDPAVAWRLPWVLGHHHAAHGAVKGRPVRRQVHVELGDRIERVPQQSGKEAQLSLVINAQVLKKLHKKMMLGGVADGLHGSASALA